MASLSSINPQKKEAKDASTGRPRSLGENELTVAKAWRGQAPPLLKEYEELMTAEHSLVVLPRSELALQSVTL